MQSPDEAMLWDRVALLMGFIENLIERIEDLESKVDAPENQPTGGILKWQS